MHKLFVQNSVLVKLIYSLFNKIVFQNSRYKGLHLSMMFISIHKTCKFLIDNTCSLPIGCPTNYGDR